VATVISSWASLALTLAAFDKAQRIEHGHQATLKHLVLNVLWRLPETGCRVLCLALFASMTP
jgi:hypothetical protein